jgi:orotidine-5'-phosphate decarboxylase
MAREVSTTAEQHLSKSTDLPGPSFTQCLGLRWRSSDSMLCVGLDPDLSRLPLHLRHKADGIAVFCKAIVDATARYACAFKPQIAYFSDCRAESQLEEVIRYIHERYPGIPVILDAKRGDIGSTAEHYAREAFERYRADAVTASPFMGFDSLQPYLSYTGKGLIVLCRTSNPGGSDLQSLRLESGEQLFERIASLAAGPWNANGQLGLVVGATFPEELSRVRRIAPDLPLLVPGIGAQGGDIRATVLGGRDAAGYGLIFSSSRAILYASDQEDFAQAAANAARQSCEAIRAEARRGQ